MCECKCWKGKPSVKVNTSLRTITSSVIVNQTPPLKMQHAFDILGTKAAITSLLSTRSSRKVKKKGTETSS